MENTTIKAYAESRHITYEAVSKQIRQYKKKELKKHISYQGRLMLLDDYAVNFLDQHRMKRNIVLAPTSDEIKRDIQQLQNDLRAALEENGRLKDQLINLQREHMQLIEDKAKNDALLMIADKEHEELEHARQELNKYKPSLFGFYRKTE